MLVPKNEFADKEIVESKCAKIRFGYRNPLSGNGWKHGIADYKVVQHYMEGLDNACKYLVANGWPDINNKIPVYLAYTTNQTEHCFGYAVGPRTGLAHLGLSSSSYEVSSKLAKQQRLATALHEVVHFYQFHCNDRCEMNEFGWHWWNEATATAIEAIVYPKDVDRFRYLESWINFPHKQPDSESGYQSFPLATFLCDHIAPDVLANTFLDSSDHPFEAIERVVKSIGDGRPFANPTEDDYFLEYCREAYFLDGPSKWQNQAKELLGQRLVTYTFDKYPHQFGPKESWINQLGCRYFRLTQPQLNSLVTIECLTKQDFQHAEVGLYSVDLEGNCLPNRHQPERDTDQLKIRFRPDKTEMTDHYVLSVGNTSFGRGAYNYLQFKILVDNNV